MTAEERRCLLEDIAASFVAESKGVSLETLREVERLIDAVDAGIEPCVPWEQVYERILRTR